MLLGAISDTAYDIVLVLHILCAIVGFGAVFLNGIYGQQAGARQGKEGLAIFQANKLVSTVGEYFIYAVFLLGVLLVLLSDDVWKFDQAWIWLSIMIFLAALGVSHGLLRPRVNQMERLMTRLVNAGPPAEGAGGPPPEAMELEQLGKTVGVIGTALNVALVIILVLMVTKPGL